MFPSESYEVSEVDGHETLSRVSDREPIYYYMENGQMAEQRHEVYGRTIWNLDGTVKLQERFFDPRGNPVEERRTSPPWWWGATDETSPSAPWWNDSRLALARKKREADRSSR